MRLKQYLYIVSIVALTACTSEELTPSDAVGEEIRLSAATVSGNTAVTTRADEGPTYKPFSDKTTITMQVSGTWTGHSPETVTLPTTATPSASNSNDLSLIQAIYWDDYGSADPANAETGRKEGLTIYGVAVDGETTAPEVKNWRALDLDLGTDQTSGISAKDLLISNNVKDDKTYKFESRADGKQLEFHHVLSKITVNLYAGEGFENHSFAQTPVVELTSNEANSSANKEWAYTEGTINVTTDKLTLTGTSHIVKMAQAATTAEGYTVTKEALVMPGSTFANDKAIIFSINADGNIYYVTAEKIRTAINATDHGNGTPYPTEAGKNYIFNVTVNKTGITVTAAVKNWETVNTEKETPAINFTADVTSINKDNDGLTDGDTFTLWKMSDLTDEAFTKAKKTLVTYENDAFTYVPQLYWDHALDNSFFRALAQKGTTLTAVEEPTLEQGTDLLWGTTAKHTGTEADGTTTHEYDEGDAINPRTGDVPLIFKHVMSNVVVKLETTTDDSQVETGGATITMTKLYKDGKFSLFTGEITSVTNPSTITVDGETIMVPQNIDDEAKLIIKLKDGTTYSLLLSTCKDTNGFVKTWESGKQYEYTISLQKEEIQFRVMVKEWTKDESSGKATLDWD